MEPLEHEKHVQKWRRHSGMIAGTVRETLKIRSSAEHETARKISRKVQRVFLRTEFLKLCIKNRVLQTLHFTEAGSQDGDI